MDFTAIVGDSMAMLPPPPKFDRTACCLRFSRQPLPAGYAFRKNPAANSPLVLIHRPGDRVFLTKEENNSAEGVNLKRPLSATLRAPIFSMCATTKLRFACLNVRQPATCCWLLLIRVDSESTFVIGRISSSSRFVLTHAYQKMGSPQCPTATGRDKSRSSSANIKSLDYSVVVFLVERRCSRSTYVA